VLSYFVRYPEAADTLEGVARWRLLDELARRTVEETASAVKWLVAQGLLTESMPPGSAPVYALNKARMAEAKQLVGLSRRPTHSKR
jgi:hypothetical protein